MVLFAGWLCYSSFMSLLVLSLFTSDFSRSAVRYICRKGDDTVENPHRARISQFELVELILLLKVDKQLPVQRFEATVSQSTVPPPPLLWSALVSSSCKRSIYIYIYIYIKRERERDTYTCYVYIYIDIYIYVYMYICIT